MDTNSLYRRFEFIYCLGDHCSSSPSTPPLPPLQTRLKALKARSKSLDLTLPMSDHFMIGLRFREFLSYLLFMFLD
ncbi:MAG: hypothetical protein ACRDIB_04005, partial [Ardenticatenaceae bacterium]